METQKALLSVFRDFPDATYVFDRGYDANDHFKFLYLHKKQFIIRIKEYRIVYNKGRRWLAATLRDTHKGKINVSVIFEGKETSCYVSHLNARITADRHPLKLLLIYGLTLTPMMLVTNKAVKGKEDVARIVRSYCLLAHRGVFQVQKAALRL
ncbi:MAG: hypothetical protein AB9880_08525 [Christensenellales bacterium]